MCREQCNTRGWKSTKAVLNNGTAIDFYCNFPTNFDEAMDCFDKETFNLTDTILNTDLPFKKNTVRTDNMLWKQTIFDTWKGINSCFLVTIHL